MNEEWRAVAIAPDYEVSSLGRVRQCRTCTKARAEARKARVSA